MPLILIKCEVSPIVSLISAIPRNFASASRFAGQRRRLMTEDRPIPPMPTQEQEAPGTTDVMSPRPDHGEDTYRGSDQLVGKVALITGGDSGIGRAVAIAFAREGANVLISYVSEDEDAAETARLLENEG